MLKITDLVIKINKTLIKINISTLKINNNFWPYLYKGKIIDVNFINNLLFFNYILMKIIKFLKLIKGIIFGINLLLIKNFILLIFNYILIIILLILLIFNYILVIFIDYFYS